MDAPVLSSVRCRTSQESDFDAVESLMRSCGYSRNAAYAAFASGTSVVAESGGKVIAFANSSGHDEVPLLDIAVAEECRRQGIGRKLLAMLYLEVTGSEECECLSFDEADWSAEGSLFAKRIGFQRETGTSIYCWSPAS